MSKKLSTDDVQRWMRRLRASEAWREPHEQKWSRMVGYLKGMFIPEGKLAIDEDYVGVNLVHPLVRVIVPAVYSNNPDVLVTGRKRGYEEAAKAMAQLLKYLMKELDLKKEMDLCIVDAILAGHAWMKNGYQTDFEEIEAEGKTMRQQAKEAMEELKEKLKSAITGQVEDYPEKSYYHIERNEKIVSQRPWVRRKSPFDIFVPAYSRRDDELPWIAERSVIDYHDAKKNPAWKTSKLQPSGDVRRLLADRDQMFKATYRMEDADQDEDMQYVVIWEIWDGRENCVYTIAEDNEEPLSYDDNIYSGIYDTRFPYERLCFNDVTDDFYPMGEVDAWEAQIHELNETRTQMNKHRKRYNRRYIVREGAFEPQALEDLKRGNDGTLCMTKEDDIDKLVHPVVDAQLPPEVYAVESRIKEDITEISGITGYQRGNVQGGANSATEAAIVESQSQYRVQDRINRISQFAQKIVTKIAQCTQLFLPLENISEILGEEAMFWVNLKDKKMIRGEFLYDVVYGSTSPINIETERQQAMLSYRDFIQNPVVDVGKITVDALRAQGKSDPESYLIPGVAQQLNDQKTQQAMMAAMGGEGGQGLVDPYGQPLSAQGNPTSGAPSSASMLSSFKRTGDVRPPGAGGGGFADA